MDEAGISYRTRKFLSRMADMRISDKRLDYNLAKILARESLGARSVIVYEWPEVTFLKAEDVDSCAYDEVRRHPQTLRLLLEMRDAKPAKAAAVPYCRKKLAAFREMARQALPEWDEELEEA